MVLQNDFIKCSNLKWNHGPQASGFTAKFWTFYGVISMVYKSVHRGKLWSICFFTITFIFLRKNKTTGTAWHVASFLWCIISWTIAIDQSAREDSLSYCKTKYWAFSLKIQKRAKFLLMLTNSADKSAVSKHINFFSKPTDQTLKLKMTILVLSTFLILCKFPSESKSRRR